MDFSNTENIHPLHNSKLANLNEEQQPKRKKIKTEKEKGVIGHAFLFPCPSENFANVIIFVLKFTKILTIKQLWIYISFIFPFYKNNFDVAQGVKKVRNCIRNHPKFFLHTEETNQPNCKCFTLNPLEMVEQDKAIETLIKDIGVFASSLYDAGQFDILLQGDWQMNESISLDQNSKNEIPDSVSVTSPASTLIAPFGSPPPYLEEEMHSPKSDDSDATVHFDLKILECRSLNKEETDQKEMALSNIEKTKKWVEGQTNMSNTNGAFTNTVWSSEGNPLLIEQPEPSTTQSNNYTNATIVPVPIKVAPVVTPKDSIIDGIEKRIKQWKKIFPWIIWKPECVGFSCEICQSIFSGAGKELPLGFMKVETTKDVAKMMKAHAKDFSHLTAEVIRDKKLISVLQFYLKNNLTKFKTVEEMVTDIKNSSSFSVEVTQERLATCLEVVSHYLEDRTIQQMRAPNTYLSIVCDDGPARTLIVRSLVGFRTEENLLPSFMNSDLNWSDYLDKLIIPRKNIIEVVSLPGASLNNLNLRIPSIEMFLNGLWQKRLMIPAKLIQASIRKLYSLFPRKFCHIKDQAYWAQLDNFIFYLPSFTGSINYFENLKSAATEIYNSTGNLDALGFMNLDMSKFTYIKVFLNHLQGVLQCLKDYDCLKIATLDFHETLNKCMKELRGVCRYVKERLKSDESWVKTLQEEDIDDLLCFLETVVTEVKKPIYCNNRDAFKTFLMVTDLEVLKRNKQNKCIDMSSLLNIMSPIKWSADQILDGQLLFLERYTFFSRQLPAKVLQFFEEHPEAQQAYPSVNSLYLRISIFPFVPSINNLFPLQIKLTKRNIRKTPWSELGPESTNHVLSILNQNEKSLNEKEVQLWWVKMAASQFYFASSLIQ